MQPPLFGCQTFVNCLWTSQLQVIIIIIKSIYVIQGISTPVLHALFCKVHVCKIKGGSSRGFVIYWLSDDIYLLATILRGENAIGYSLRFFRAFAPNYYSHARFKSNSLGFDNKILSTVSSLLQFLVSSKKVQG